MSNTHSTRWKLAILIGWVLWAIVLGTASALAGAGGVFLLILTGQLKRDGII